jgi:CHAT domain-containing protein
MSAVHLATSELHELVGQFRESLNRPKSNDYKVLGKRLYDQLINPVANEVAAAKALSIVPHGVLLYLPFDALYSGRDFLIDSKAVRMLPSASVLKFLNKRKGSHNSILVLGNPDLGDGNLDLAGAQQEAIAIARIQNNARLLLRGKATETTVKVDGSAYKYLHFASHGVFDDEAPLESRLLLAKDAANDGNLTVSELYNLKLDADLVTLSACETALGSVANGDDVVGFTRGFLYAGANSIVSSLWKVDDDATNQLMQKFYQNLDRMDKRQALTQAQLAVKKKYKHPYYWAAFQLTGSL